jgi:hypothetical protein
MPDGSFTQGTALRVGLLASSIAGIVAALWSPSPLNHTMMAC